ncbi:MAG TPA: SDR family NAD(P)-dependent oxidoreductase, partial [Thermoanaerobaculia bacterium]|nr:SDR family NAD(P)-dependent oxidoreductase [Thermoanaerobaculia bacterium]
MSTEIRSRWAVVLGASSGFGEACSLALARAGWNVFGVHLDRKSTQANADRIVAEIASAGRRAEFFNVNAADDGKRGEVVAAIAEKCGGSPPESRVSVFLHSLAFGTLKP